MLTPALRLLAPVALLAALVAGGAHADEADEAARELSALRLDRLGLALEAPGDWRLSWVEENGHVRALLGGPGGALATLERWTTRRDVAAALARLEQDNPHWRVLEPAEVETRGAGRRIAHAVYGFSIPDTTTEVRLFVQITDTGVDTWLFTWGARADDFDADLARRMAHSIERIETTTVAAAGETREPQAAGSGSAAQPQAAGSGSAAQPPAQETRDGAQAAAAENTAATETAAPATAATDREPAPSDAGASVTATSAGSTPPEPEADEQEADEQETTAPQPADASAQAAAVSASAQPREVTAGARVRADLQGLAIAIDLFASDTGNLPHTLTELLVSDRPGWQGPYLGDGDEGMLRDPWGRPYVYARVGSGKPPYLLGSFGADGRAGGEGEAADVFNRTDVPPPGAAPQPMPQPLAERIRSDLLVLRVAIRRFEHDTGRLPATLDALVDGRGIEGWRGPYVLGGHDGLLDPWQRPYLYERPAPDGAPWRVGTLGADGQPGGEGADTDVFETGGDTQ